MALAGALSLAGGDADAEQPGWRLIWADEFDGTALDASKWNIQLGDGSAYDLPGWGNNELQTYRAENIAVANGQLAITARRENLDGQDYTSARINTAGKFHARYGRFEASIHAPAGQGLWSAFWMLPEHSRYGPWAASGEIDIMEVYGRHPTPFVLGTAHYGMAWPLNVYVGGRSTRVDPADGFHVYALEWDEQALRWFVDGIHYHTAPHTSYWTSYRSSATNAHVAGGDSAPFDQPFHLLLNLAVGGNLPGDPEPSALPARLLVDYVRAYRCDVDPRTGLGCAGSADPIDESVPPAPPSDVFRRQYVLYDDALGPLAFADSAKTAALDFAIDDNGGAFALSEADGGERGRFIDLRTSGGGHFSILAAKRSRHRFYGMGDATLAADLAGELQFDLYVSSAETDANGSLQVRLDSGPQSVGFVQLPIGELPLDQWTTITVQISDIVHNPGDAARPVDLARVRSLFGLAHTGAAHMRLDNIKILCAHSVRDGCGIAPPG